MASRKIEKRRKRTLREKFKYSFDNVMSEGMLAKVGVLMAVTLGLICILGLIAALVPHNGQSKLQLIWQSFLHALDPGTIAGDTDFEIGYVAVMLVVTIFGLMFTGTLISIINNGMEAKMNSLAKGKSQIYEEYTHTVVLGFRDTTVSIIEELVKANENQKHRCPVLILDNDRTPEEMDDIIDEKLRMLKGRRKTKVICRKGSIFDASALDICSFECCDSIIINGKDDFETIKSILAVSTKLRKLDEAAEKAAKETANKATNKGSTQAASQSPCTGKNVPPRPKLAETIPIVAILSQHENMREARYAGGSNVRVLCYDQIISKIIAGAGREAGLSFVYSNLFNFDDVEFYCTDKDTKKIKELPVKAKDLYRMSTHLENAIIVGGVKAGTKIEEHDGHKGCNQLFTSSKNESLSNYSKFIVLQEDDDPIYTVEKPASSYKVEIKKPVRHTLPAEYSIVILGYSDILEQVLREEDGAFKGRKCSVLIASSNPAVMKYGTPEINAKYKNLDLSAEVIEIKDDQIKHVLEIAKSKTKQLKSVIILAEHEDSVLSDEETLRKLIFLRHIRAAELVDDASFNITCEIRQDCNRLLAEYSGANDFIIGSSIMATITVQVAQTPELYEVFCEILSNDGSEIYMQKATDYFQFTGKTRINYVDMIRAAAKADEIWIGISQPTETDGFRHYEPRLITQLYNRKTKEPEGCEISEDDEFVVIAKGMGA